MTTQGTTPGATQQLSCKVTRAGGSAVLRLEGPIDSVTAPDLDGWLAPLTTAEGTNLLLDLSGVGYISSAGLRSVMTAHKASIARGGSVAICSVQPHVRGVFDVSGFDKVIPVYESCHVYLARKIENFEPARAENRLQRNKNAVLRFLMILQFCNYADLADVVHESMKTKLSPSLDHDDEGTSLASADDFAEHLKQLHSLLDMEIVIESMIAEGDYVATNNITRRHYRDGRTMSTRFLSFYRLKDGKIIEKTDVYDRLDEQQQLAAQEPTPA